MKSGKLEGNGWIANGIQHGEGGVQRSRRRVVGYGVACSAEEMRECQGWAGRGICEEQYIATGCERVEAQGGGDVLVC